jgi:hypothetical protein
MSFTDNRGPAVTADANFNVGSTTKATFRPAR